MTKAVLDSRGYFQYNQSWGMRLITLLFCFVAISCHTLSAQYQLNGSAVEINDSCYQLTNDQSNQVGSIWFEEKINLEEVFDLRFDIYLGANDGGADGVLFGLQPISTSIGTNGQGLGFGGVMPSIGVEFDTYTNGDFSDLAEDHMSIARNGDLNHSSVNNLAGPIPMTVGGTNVEDGQYYNIRIVWDPSTQALRAFFECGPPLTYVGDIVNEIFGGDPEVFWGFTAATGLLSNDQIVCFNYISFEPTAADLAVCPGDSVQLSAQEGWNNYSWEPAALVSDASIANPYAFPVVDTEFIVTILDECGIAIRDTIMVTQSSGAGLINLGDDVIVCSDDLPYTLDAGVVGADYEWQDGSNQQTFDVNATGVYSVQVDGGAGCVDMDTIVVTVEEPAVIELPNELGLCAGESAEVDYTVTIDGVSTTESITVMATNTFSVTPEPAQDACVVSESINVFTKPLPSLDLGDITEICDGSFLEVTLSDLFDSVVWSDGSEDFSRFISIAGIYEVTAFKDGCSNSDSFEVVIKDCDTTVIDTMMVDTTVIIQPEPTPGCRLRFPTAFSPNGDGENDVFRGFDFECELEAYTMKIYDRWGRLLFNGPNRDFAWDGFDLNGEKMPMGVYVYVVEYSSGGLVDAQGGNITLIR